MTDKILAALSLAMLIAFLSVVIGFVAEIDLAIVVILVLLMAAYDFWITVRSSGDQTDGTPTGK